MNKISLHHLQQSKHTERDKSRVGPACDGQTELFFSERTRDMREAQLVCAGCSIRSECLDQARQSPPFAGVWGGVVFVNGEEQLNKRGRGRPRKSESLDNARVRKALEHAAHNDEMNEKDGPSPNIVKQIA